MTDDELIAEMDKLLDEMIELTEQLKENNDRTEHSTSDNSNTSILSNQQVLGSAPARIG